MIVKEENKYKRINANEKTYLGFGIEGITYRDNEDAVKLFHSERSSFLEEETAIYMTSINTERFLLPKKLIYNRNNKFIGYRTKFIKNDNKDEIFTLSKKDLIDNFDKLIKESVKLAEHGIVIDDNNFSNMNYNDKKIYFVDPGSYFYDEDDRMTFYGRFQANYAELNEFAEELLSKAAIKNLEISPRLKEIIEEEEMITELLREEMQEDENLLMYTRRI